MKTYRLQQVENIKQTVLRWFERTGRKELDKLEREYPELSLDEKAHYVLFAEHGAMDAINAALENEDATWPAIISDCAYTKDGSFGAQGLLSGGSARQGRFMEWVSSVGPDGFHKVEAIVVDAEFGVPHIVSVFQVKFFS